MLQYYLFRDIMKLWIIYIYVVGVVCSQCPNGWVHHDSSCYSLRSDTETWMDAELVCEFDGGHLAEIGDERENTFIHGLNIVDSDIWLGGTDLSIEGEWIWVKSGLDMTYKKWHSGEPNNQGHDENCLQMDRQGLWSDKPCREFKKYVCEIALTGTEIIG